MGQGKYVAGKRQDTYQTGDQIMTLKSLFKLILANFTLAAFCITTLENTSFARKNTRSSKYKHTRDDDADSDEQGEADKEDGENDGYENEDEEGTAADDDEDADEDDSRKRKKTVQKKKVRKK